MRRLLPLAFLPLIAPLIAIAGCTAARISAPSLAPRPVERQPIDLPDAAAEPETAADPTLIAKLAGLVARAEDAHRGFEREHAASQVLIRKAAGQPEGSEAWVQAQQAVSGLESAQGPLRDIAGEVAELRKDEANFAPGNRAAIDQAAAKVDVLAEAEAKAVSTASKK